MANGMISIRTKGDFSKFNSFCERLLEIGKFGKLDKYGQMGVDALSSYTPVDTGLLASSWRYDIERTKDSVAIVWSNTDIEGGYNVALLVQYGHGNGHGGYVQGIDYINPALAPVFEQILTELIREV